MSVGAWAVMLGPVPGVAVLVPGSVGGAAMVGWEVVVVVVGPGSWHTYGGFGVGASAIVLPGCAATQACFHVWL